jgi:hypothetical protein
MTLPPGGAAAAPGGASPASGGAAASPGGASPASGQPSTGRTFATYTVARFLIFFVLTAVLFGIGAGIVALTGHALDGRSVKPIVLAAAFVAAPLSMVVSYLALARQREVITFAVAERVERYRARAAARTAAEDAYVDQLAAQPHAQEQPGAAAEAAARAHRETPAQSQADASRPSGSNLPPTA